MDSFQQAELRDSIRTIPDYPKPGIMFRDITTLLADGGLFQETIDAMAAPFSDIDKVVIIESRGFILGTPIAYALRAGVVPVRKPGRLPWKTHSEEYALEYGTNMLEVHQDAINPGERVLIVDDVLATGGTAAATARLVDKLGGVVVGFGFLIELGFLSGRDVLGGRRITSLITYD